MKDASDGVVILIKAMDENYFLDKLSSISPELLSSLSLEEKLI